VAAIIADVSDETGPEERATDEPPRHPPLTRRELDLLRFLVQGMANKEIAAEMELSEGTVKNTLQQLFARTGVRTRAQLVRVALEEYRDLL
jgi:two-component system nitrate/nitrite response regulator NarL